MMVEVASSRTCCNVHLAVCLGYFEIITTFKIFGLLSLRYATCTSLANAKKKKKKHFYMLRHGELWYCPSGETTHVGERRQAHIGACMIESKYKSKN